MKYIRIDNEIHSLNNIRNISLCANTLWFYYNDGVKVGHTFDDFDDAMIYFKKISKYLLAER